MRQLLLDFDGKQQDFARVTPKTRMYGGLLIVMYLISICSFGHGYEEPGTRMARRCGRGMIDLASAPFETINSIEDTRIKEGMMNALTVGTLKGAASSFARAGYGLYEMVTFYRYHDERAFGSHYDSALIRLTDE